MIDRMPSIAGLESALAQLVSRPPVKAAVAALAARQEAINQRLGAQVLSQIPAFTESHNPALVEQMASHGASHTRELLRLLGGGDVTEFEFVREHARRRAEQHFPLEAMLHSYRCGHKYYVRELRDAVLSQSGGKQDSAAVHAAIADFAIEYTDIISYIAAAEYTDRSRLMADIAVDTRTHLLETLLGGYDESDRRVSGLLRAAGYLDQRQSFCVALAQSADPAEMALPERARRMASSIEKTVAASTRRCLVDLYQNRVTMIFSQQRRASGWTAPRRKLSPQVHEALEQVGISCRIGVSDDVPSTSYIPAAYRAAQVALDFASARRAVVSVAELRLRDVLVHEASESVRQLNPAWSAHYLEADRAANRAFTLTLRAYADASMNVQKAALRLGVHANTVYTRLQRIEDLTGLDPRRFHALTELLLVHDLGLDHSA